jgi:multisubunit Na+/H+ antiporter MnhE subunit
VRAEIAFFANHMFMAILVSAVLLLVLSFMVAGFQPATSAIVFVLYWCWLLVIIKTPFDVALQLKDPEASIAHLRQRMQA